MDSKNSPHYPIVFVHWLDANYMEGLQDLAELDWKADLEYVGWLVKETPEAITLSLEKPVEGKTRNPFTILKRTIVNMYELSGRKPRRKRSPQASDLHDAGRDAEVQGRE